MRNATTDIPEVSIRHVEAVNPPRRRGRLETNTRKVSQADPLTRFYHRVETVSGESDRSKLFYMDW